MNSDCRDFEQEVGKWYLVAVFEIYHLVLHMGMGNKKPNVGKEKQKNMRH